MADVMCLLRLDPEGTMMGRGLYIISARGDQEGMARSYLLRGRVVS